MRRSMSGLSQALYEKLDKDYQDALAARRAAAAAAEAALQGGDSGGSGGGWGPFTSPPNSDHSATRPRCGGTG